MSFMTIEGDRSGVSIPTKQEKAANKVRAALDKLSNIETISTADIDAAIEDLKIARFHLQEKE